MRPLGIGPEPERDADGVRPRAQERDRGVDAAAHRHRDAAGGGRCAEDRAERVRQRVDRERLAADRRGLEERQAPQVAIETLGVGIDDPLAVHTQADECPAPVARRVTAYLVHSISVPHPADCSAP